MSELCERCRAFDLQSLNNETGCLEIPLSAVVSGSQAGCIFCISIGEALHRSQRNQMLYSLSEQSYVELYFYSTSPLRAQGRPEKQYNWMSVRLAPRFAYQSLVTDGEDTYPFLSRKSAAQFYLVADEGINSSG